GLGSPHDLVDNVAVSAVHAVEVTDAQDRGTEVAGDVVELAKSLHAIVFRRRSQAVSFSDFVIPSEARDLQFAAICRSLASLGMTIFKMFRQTLRFQTSASCRHTPGVLPPVTRRRLLRAAGRDRYA